MPFGEPEEDQATRRLNALLGAIADADLKNRQAAVDMLKHRREKEAAASALEPYQTAMAGPPKPTGATATYQKPGMLENVGAKQAAYPNAREQRDLALGAILNLSKQGTPAAQQTIGNLQAAKVFMPEEIKRESEVTAGNWVWNPDTEQYEQVGERYVPPRNKQLSKRLKKDAQGNVVYESVEGKKLPVYETFDLSEPNRVIAETLGTAIGPPGKGGAGGKGENLFIRMPTVAIDGTKSQTSYKGTPEEVVSQMENRMRAIDRNMSKAGKVATKKSGFLGLWSHAGWDEFKKSADIGIDQLDPQIRSFGDEYTQLQSQIADIQDQYGLSVAEEPGEGTPEEEGSSDEEPEGGGASKLTDEDKQAIAWAKANPKDPRAAKILKMHGVK